MKKGLAVNKEITIPILNSIIGPGEPGDPLTQPVIDLIRSMAKVGWAVLDFGEPSDITMWNHDMTDLRFVYDTQYGTEGDDGSITVAEYFIKSGGNV